MNYLRYSSDEMFSSTELIRKSKSIFDKLNNKSIEKAIILRDGKPGFMLLDFATYERIMKDYEKLNSKAEKKDKEQYMSLDEIEVSNSSKKTKKIEVANVAETIENSVEIKPLIEEKKIEVKESISEDVTQIEDMADDEINEEELLKALDEIDQMSMLSETKIEVKTELENDDFEDDFDDDFKIALDEIKEEEKTQPLKEFWDN